MTFQEIIDDAKTDVNAYGSFVGLTNKNLLRYVTTALNEIQNKTHVLKTTITVATLSLDSNGTAPLPLGVTVPTRCVYTPNGGTLIGSQEVETCSPDDMAKWKSIPATFSSTVPMRKLHVALEQNRLLFWPFQGLNGTFTFTVYSAMPVFYDSLAADPNSIWYQWDDAHGLAGKMASTLIPQEFVVAGTAITAYVAAKLLQAIPGWKRLFKEDYNERMLIFESCFDTIKQDQPIYPLNHHPKPNYGWGR